MSEIDTVSSETVVNDAPSAEAAAPVAKPTNKQESLVEVYEKAKRAYYEAKDNYESELCVLMAELADRHGLLMLESQYLKAKKDAFRIIAKSPSHVSAVTSAKAEAKAARQTLEAVTAENAAAKKRLAEMRSSFAALTADLKADSSSAELKSQVDAAKKALDAEEVSRKEVRSRLKAAKQDADTKAKAAAALRKG